MSYKPYDVSTPDTVEWTQYYVDQTGAQWLFEIVSYRCDGMAHYDGIIRAVEIKEVDYFPGALIVTTRPEMTRYREELKRIPRRSAAALEGAKLEFFEMARVFKDVENLILQKFEF